MKRNVLSLIFLTLPMLGENVSAPVEGSLHPVTCEGDVRLNLSSCYWTAKQEGLSYAIETPTYVPLISPTPEEIRELNNIRDGQIHGPIKSWDWGFKIGIAYNASPGRSDIGLEWTHFRPQSHTYLAIGIEDNVSIITLQSAFSPIQGGINFAREIQTQWKGNFDLVDSLLGNTFWVGQRCHLRPEIGVRYAHLDQRFAITQKGGSWSPRLSPPQSALNNYIKLKSSFRGLGLICGFGGTFPIGCGVEIYASSNATLAYGRFKVSHEEKNRLPNPPQSKSKVLDTRASFRASRAILDMEAGIRYRAEYCDCTYGIEIALSWEQHLFAHQNPFFRVVRIGDTSVELEQNNTGQNIYQQLHGNLTTQGWTLSCAFVF